MFLPSPSSTRFLPVMAMLTALAIATVSFSAQGALLGKSPEDFVKDAWNGNQFEVEASQLALSRTQNSDVRDFAQSMVNDHSKVGEDLTSTVSTSTNASKIKIPTALDGKHQGKLDNLKNATTDFDRKYADAQKDAHDDAVSLFRDYAKDGEDTVLKSFASRHQPDLESHQQKAKALKDKVEKAK